MSVNEISKPYYVALDIGTTSVGWAVLNEEYMLEKFKKKNMWGVRLFEEGKTAKSTRLFRSARRMLSRKKQRIALLKELIGEMVLEVDKNFFMRLEKGYVHEDERGYHYNLFIDEDFNDKDFYKKYPTIYHLRKHLCESDKKEDPRLIYLAMHHILKHRGHFLYEVENFNIANQDLVKSSLKRALESLFMQFENESITYDLDDILTFLLNKSISNKKKEEQFKDYFVGLDKEGVKFSELPANWVCPLCGVGRELFELVEEELKEDLTPSNAIRIDKDNPGVVRLVDKCINCGVCTQTCVI